MSSDTSAFFARGAISAEQWDGSAGNRIRRAKGSDLKYNHTQVVVSWTLAAVAAQKFWRGFLGALRLIGCDTGKKNLHSWQSRLRQLATDWLHLQSHVILVQLGHI